MHDSGADDHCVLHMHHGKSIDACILLLYCVYGAQSGVDGPIQLRSTAQSPVLSAWIAPLDETKVHDSVANGHCVLHMHHGKSLDACILLLHCFYGGQGGVNGSILLRSTAQSLVLTAWIAPLEETKVHDSAADGHCVLHMHHGKSLDACILLLHCVYGAQGGVNILSYFYIYSCDIVGLYNLPCKIYKNSLSLLYSAL